MTIPIELVNLEHRFVVAQDFTVWPIARMVDAWGDECTPAEATFLVCGDERQHFTLELRYIPPPVFH